MELYVGCVAGALEQSDYLAKLQTAGFEQTSIEPTRRYEFSKLEGSWAGMSLEEREALDGKIFSGFVRAVRPASR
jgi:hypothetical protein